MDTHACQSRYIVSEKHSLNDSAYLADRKTRSLRGMQIVKAKQIPPSKAIFLNYQTFSMRRTDHKLFE